MALDMSLQFRAVDEPTLGPKWTRCFSRAWPAYRRWFLSEGEALRPTYRQVVRALRRYMPELLPNYERMTELAGGGDFAARFLGQYCPPPFFAACSQAILLNPEPVLVRNYDYSPLLCDGLIMNTRWGSRSVIASTDCMSGVLDGMNKSGLVISLAFGGRRVVDKGFGITLVQRHILESCGNVAEACDELCRIPIQVAYNIALVDRHGDHATVMVSPDRSPIISKTQVSTNHQQGERWEKYTQMIETDTRLEFLQSTCRNTELSPDAIVDQFLTPPLFRNSYAMGYGTIFTAAYFPCRGEARYHWKDGSWIQRFDAFKERRRTAVYTDSTANPDKSPSWPPMPGRTARIPEGFIAR